MHAAADQHDPAIGIIGIGRQAFVQTVHHARDHGFLLTGGQGRCFLHLLAAGAGNRGGGDGGAAGANTAGWRGRCGLGEAGGNINPFILGDLPDHPANIGGIRGVGGRVFEQGEPVIDRAFVIAGNVLLDREEIARARILWIVFEGIAKGLGRISRHLLPVARHDQGLAQHRPIFGIVRIERGCPFHRGRRFGKFAGLEIAPPQHPPAFGVIGVLLQLLFQPGDHFTDAWCFLAFARAAGERHVLARTVVHAAIDLDGDRAERE